MERLTCKKAPDFKMQAVTGDGESFFDASLSSYRGKWLILFFYPKDFTFVCPTEITGFSEKLDLFNEADAEILAVSTDSEYCHQAWIRNGLGAIRYPLAADKTLKVSSDYGVLLEDEGIALRGLFIIDPDQVVRYSVIHDNNVGRSTDEIYRVLKALQTDALCGADWSVGSSPLKIDESPVLPNITVSSKVRIYTLPDCSYCQQVKKFLLDNNIDYEEINLERDTAGQQFMEDRGYTALPVTVIGTNEVSGYRMDTIKKLLFS